MARRCNHDGAENSTKIDWNYCTNFTMSETFKLTLDRGARVPLAGQIHAALAAAIRDGRLAGGARLPSWRDLAAQLGVSRGTVRAAYERLIDEQLVIGLGAAGTRVAAQLSPQAKAAPELEAPPLPLLFQDFSRPPLVFQMGVPAEDAFPVKLWSRLAAAKAREAAALPVTYPDPRGEPVLRREIAAYLAIARGIQCAPAQVFITGGYAGALGLVLQALRLAGRRAWMEEPGFPLTRIALASGGVTPLPVPVDGEGLDVAAGLARAPDAALAVVTPGQQAPLGVALSLRRRLALLDWTAESGAWVLEDDYLSELQLSGRSPPALASLDRAGRVLHAGTFSKTISPALRLGFLVVPPDLVGRFGEVATSLALAGGLSQQLAVAAFLAEGHHLRHLRRMKRLYAQRRDLLLAHLAEATRGTAISASFSGGLAVRLALPGRAEDLRIANEALAFGLAPVPLSPWYAEGPRPRGLVLGITNLVERRLPADCARLVELAERFGGRGG